MTLGLLFNHDDLVAKTLYAERQWSDAFKYDRAVGVVNAEGKLCGSFLFHFYNGFNVELTYYGESALSPGVIRTLARFILFTFDPARLTVTTSKRNRRWMQSLQRFGFKVEGAQRCYYGRRDCNRNTAVRFVMFRPRLEQLAKLAPVTADAA